MVKSDDSVSLRMAIYWDWQNVRANSKQVQSVIRFANARAAIQFKTIYADWQIENSQRNRELANLFYSLDFVCIHVPAFEKNRADYRLINDCRQQVLAGSTIDTVLLISGDRDFGGMVNQLRQSGKRVIVISRCPNNTSQKLMKMANEFHYLDQIDFALDALPLTA